MQLVRNRKLQGIETVSPERNRNGMKQGVIIVVGAAIGAGVGVAIGGLALIGFGTAIGVAIGVAIAVSLEKDGKLRL